MRALKIRRYAVHREIQTDLVAQHRRFGLALGWHAVVGEAQYGQGIGLPDRLGGSPTYQRDSLTAQCFSES